MKLIAALLVGVGLGCASAWFFTGPLWMDLPYGNGPWRTSAYMGNEGDNIYLRAYVSRIAWFSNDPGKNIYFEAWRDSEGRPLDIRCDYIVKGSDPAARWWSLTAYSDRHWIPNDLNRYSFAGPSMVRSSNGDWTIEVSPSPAQGNWLPTTGATGTLSLMLRLYDVAPEWVTAVSTVPLPTISREACG